MTQRLPVRSAMLLLAVLAFPSASSAVVRVPDGFVNETIIKNPYGLVEPNSFAFLPDWRMLVTEQHRGYIRLVVGARFGQYDPAARVFDFNTAGYEQGLQGIAVDPAWPDRPFIYVAYTQNAGHVRLLRFTGVGQLDDPDGLDLAFINPVVILDVPDNHETHNGGCLRFGPDGCLYFTNGDDGEGCAACDPTSLQGVIVRLRTSTLEENITGPVSYDLLTPPDNPFSTSPDSSTRLVWANGLRNPWRFQIDPVTGRIYLADVGLASYEEINEVLPGEFFGWPYREGPMLVNPYPTECPEPGGPGTKGFRHGIVEMSRNPNISVSIIVAGRYRPTFAAPYNWPDGSSGYEGDLFYGEYYSGAIYRMRSVDGAWQAAPPVAGQPDSAHWATGLESMVDFQFGPDGSLWWLSQYDSTFIGETGSIHRIRYVGPSATLAVGDGFGAKNVSFVGYPNPFSRHANLVFRLPRAGPARIDIYDLAGRRVRRLMEGEAPAGETRASWDGHDAQGVATPPGVYLARLEFTGGRKSVRLLRLQ